MHAGNGALPDTGRREREEVRNPLVASCMHHAPGTLNDAWCKLLDWIQAHLYCASGTASRPGPTPYCRQMTSVTWRWEMHKLKRLQDERDLIRRCSYCYILNKLVLAMFINVVVDIIARVVDIIVIVNGITVQSLNTIIVIIIIDTVVVIVVAKIIIIIQLSSFTCCCCCCRCCCVAIISDTVIITGGAEAEEAAGGAGRHQGPSQGSAGPAP